MSRFLRLEFEDRTDWCYSYLRNGEVLTAGVELFCLDGFVEIGAVTRRGRVATGNIRMTPANFAAMCRMFLDEYEGGDNVETA